MSTKWIPNFIKRTMQYKPNDILTAQEYNAMYNFFPDKYIRMAVIPGAAWHFYVMDEEGLQTAPQYQADFERGKFVMQRDMLYKIPEEYMDDDHAGFVVGDPESDIFGDRGLVVDIDV